MGIFNLFKNKGFKKKYPNYVELYGYTLNFKPLNIKEEGFDNSNNIYKNYTLYSIDEEDLQDFYNLLNSIIREIFKNNEILIQINFWDEIFNKSTDYIKKIFTEFNEKKDLNSDEKIFLKGNNSLIIYCSGEKTPVPMKYIEEEKYMNCTVNIYGVSSSIDIFTLEKAKEFIEGNMYEIALECCRYPDNITFSINSSKNLNYVIECIKNVCKDKKKTLYLEYQYAEE